MAQLQRPPFVYMNGRLTPWDDARIHVSSEALIRGISVFEGLKGYWDEDNTRFSIISLRQHYERLRHSAFIQHLPFEVSFEAYRDACAELAGKLLTKERDLWLRTTVYSVEGQWGEHTIADLVITAYHQDKKRPGSLDVGVSTWRKPGDVSLPARVKSAANYQISRIARVEGRRQGFDDMILLNEAGRVAEASGSCVLMARHGRIITPPAYEGCLESITVDIAEGLCTSLDIPFERRPIDRTELLSAEAVYLVGTLMEFGRVRRLESREFPEHHPLFDSLVEEFWACVRRRRANPAVPLTEVCAGGVLA